MKIYIACDHRGVDVESRLIDYFKLTENPLFSINKIHDENDDYVDFALALCKEVLKEKENLGILLCGTGIGMSIAANKVKGIRAARCVNESDAYYSKKHNDANVICLSSAIEFDKLCNIISTFITEPGASEERHLKRVNKIIKYENGAYNEL